MTMPDVTDDRSSLDATTVTLRTPWGRRLSRLLIPVLLTTGLILLPALPCLGEQADATAQQTPSTGDQTMRDASQDKRIDYIEFPAVDIGAMKKFYGGAFGWTFVDYGPDYSSFNDGRTDGGFRKEPKVEPGGPLVVLFATDLEATAARVSDQGGRITKEIFDFPGGRRFQFADPSGNELAVWSDR
jgi:predicted enzyme related to lactoylglutathione lyase